MVELIKLFFSICLFKKGPQDIPVSIRLYRLLIVVYVGVGFVNLILSSDIFNTTLQVFVQLMLVLGFCQIILFFAKKKERYLQTVCAFIATDTLISFLALPAMVLLNGQTSVLAFFYIILLMIWNWIVSGYILSQALDQRFTFGLGLAFLYILLTYQVMAWVFPQMIVE